ncbi:amphi-Trp domain-containing protein [Magnetovibrio blakemorei]|nr:amphi-Trp domain-containing protein [Magnetovibrio blakemorei]OEJ65747.1 amphi-Trp domain-containing protein [Magnetovibrio blakemorei]
MKNTGRFRHESLQDQDTIKSLLKAITSGIGEGKITLEDKNASLVMEPSGLLRIKIKASIDDDRNTLGIRISWQGEKDITKDKTLKVIGR